MSISSPSPAPGLRSRRLAILALLAAAAIGCAGRQASKAEMSWPLPPNKPRLRYVESLVGPDNFDTGFWRRVRRGILGRETGMDVFNPAGLALSPDETRLYVSCPTISRVLVFDFAKRAVRDAANVAGHRPKHPYGVATDAQGRLYVSDQADAAVWVYSPEDAFVALIGKGRLVRPTGVAIDRRRQQLYVLDGGTREKQRGVVEVFALDGRHLRTIGTRGTAAGQLLYPGFATVSPEGNLFVADSLNSRVQVFDPNGGLVGMFGSLGDQVGQFGKPKGVAFDTQGNVHVVDGQLGYVQIFDPKFRVLMLYGGLSPEAPFMRLPNGIAITSKNEIFVADYVANRVNKYVLFDTSAGDDPPTRAAAPTRAAR